MKNEILEKIKLTFRALKHRNYKLFFYGQCISLTGTWIQQIALNWLIYRLTHSAFLMGTVVFVSTLPSLILSPYLGVIIDRVNKYKALILMQVLFMLGAGALGILTVTGVVKVWHVMVLGAIVGIINAFDMPLRQAFVVNLVDNTEDLGNAISLNSSVFNLARLIGPAVAGVLIASVGEGLCFIINAVSYIAVITAFFMMNIKIPDICKKENLGVIKELKDGIKYSFNSIQIRTIIIYIGIVSLFGMFYPLLMPIYVQEILHRDAQVLGFLMSAAGLGALFGALHLASKDSVKGLEKWTCRASVNFAIGLLGLNFTNNTFVALCLLFMLGLGMVVVIASCNTLIQLFTNDEKRGRVMSLYTMAFMGTAPFGSLISGSVAQKLGTPHTFLLSGITMLFAAFWFSKKIKYFDQNSVSD